VITFRRIIEPYKEIVLPITKETLRVSMAYDIGANGNTDSLEVVKPDYLVKNGIIDYAIKFLSQH